MISIDRNSPVPLGQQLERQLRFLIASGHFRVGDRLPSTRELGRRVGVSFHTVRHAYQSLTEEGLLAARPGARFVVKAASIGPHYDRLESGAAIAAEAVERLVGLGLEEDEIEALLMEQLEQFRESVGDPLVYFAGPYPELAERCSELISDVVALPVQPVLLGELGEVSDAEYMITPFAFLRDVMSRFPDSHVVGVTVYYAHEFYESLARLLPTQTIGIAALDPTSVEPIMIDIRRQTGFVGQVFGIAAKADREEFDSLIEQTDLLVYTHQSRRRVLSRIGDQPSVEIDLRIADESLDEIRRLFARA